MLVVVFHAYFVSLQTAWATPGGGWAYPCMQTFVGVHLFLVVSGFCIHRAAAVHDPNSNPRFGAFWVRRLRRLYPPYLAAIALTLVANACILGLHQWVTQRSVSWAHVGPGLAPGGLANFVVDGFVHLFMLFPFRPETLGAMSNWVFWSLALEEQLYFLYFLLPWLRRRLGMAGTTLLVLGVSLTFRAAAIFGPLACSQPRMFGITTVANPQPLLPTIPWNVLWLDLGPSRWFEWVLGAWAVEMAVGRSPKPGWAYSWPLALLAFGLAMATQWSQAGWIVTDPLWGLGFFIVVNKLVAAEAAGRVGCQRLLRAGAGVGLFSYSLYLIHHPLLNLNTELLMKSGSFFLARNLAIVLVLVQAYVFYRLFELPALAWSKATGARKSPPV
jgi:peptidoglycan/LPS O-acetylase OafA/YrhL